MGGSDHCYFFGFSSDRNVFTANINDINLVETRTVPVLANFGCLPFTKSFRKIRLESNWNATVWVDPAENLQEQWNF